MKMLRPNQVARLLQVHPATVANMFDRGELWGLRLPSGERRVAEQSIFDLLSRVGATGKQKGT